MLNTYTNGACALKLPSSYVPMTSEEMEYLEGGATVTRCTSLKPLWLSIIGLTGGANAVYDSVKVLSTINVGAVKAALKTWQGVAGLAFLTYYAAEITTACIGLKSQGYYYLHSLMGGIFDYVTLR